MEAREVDFRGATLASVSSLAGGEIELKLEIRGPKRSARGTREVVVRFRAITNYGNVERFFFGYRAKPRDVGLDVIVSLRQTRGGWSIEMEDRGRVSVKTTEPPVVASGDHWRAGEQGDAADGG